MASNIYRIFASFLLILSFGIFISCSRGVNVFETVNVPTQPDDDTVADDDATDDDNIDDDIGPTTTTTTTTQEPTTTTTTTTNGTTTTKPMLFFDDFESYPEGGPPGSPWKEVAIMGGASATVVSLKGGSGKFVELDDPLDTDSGQLIADTSKAMMDTTTFEVSWDWLWHTGDGMGFQIFHKFLGSYIKEASIDFYIDHVEALSQTTSNWVTCISSANLDQWYHFSAVVNISTYKYTVKIDDQETNCKDLSLVAPGLPLVAIGVTMYSDVAGGITALDNVGITLLNDK